MAMGIDFSTPLTNQERKFLEERGRYSDIERADSVHGASAPEDWDVAGDGTGPQVLPVLTSEARAARKEQLLRELADIDAAEGGDAEDGEDVPPYEAWNVAELDAEIKRRNDAGASLETGGKKDEKVARLYEDDDNNAS